MKDPFRSCVGRKRKHPWQGRPCFLALRPGSWPQGWWGATSRSWGRSSGSNPTSTTNKLVAMSWSLHSKPLFLPPSLPSIIQAGNLLGANPSSRPRGYRSEPDTPRPWHEDASVCLFGTSMSEAPADCWLPKAAAGEDVPPRPLAAQPSTGQGVGGGQGSGGAGGEGVKGPGPGLGQSTNRLSSSLFPTEIENSFHTIFSDFFFHFTASKLIQNRLSNCLNFRRKVS